MRSYSIDLSNETSTQAGHAPGMWLNGVLVQPIYNTHGVDWTTFDVYRPATELEEENGSTYVSLQQHGKETNTNSTRALLTHVADVDKDHKMPKNQFQYFRITEPPMRLKAVPNCKPGCQKFLVYSEPFTRYFRLIEQLE